MLISELRFKEELNNPKGMKHNLIFIGMSGVGKTHWSKLLSEKFDYNHVEIDKHIALSKEFAELIKGISGKDETEKMGNYFGNPWDEGFQEKEDNYLAIERKLMSMKYTHSTILDLTGSALYHPEQLKKLARTGLIIYLETSEEVQQEMFKIYISDPKPVCWNGVFNKKDGESNEEALARCYPLLLKYRAEIYDKYADIKLPYRLHRNMKEPEKFIGEVCKRLKATS